MEDPARAFLGMWHLRRLGLVTLFLLATAVGSAGATPEVRLAPCPGPGDTLSLQQPQDPGYREAMEFAEVLQRNHIGLRCITRTKIGSYFFGEPRAAGFQTDLGTVTVVFFPAPNGAERIRTSLTVKGGHYHYTFSTGRWGFGRRQVIDLNAPLLFLIRGRWFVMVTDARAEEPLRLALTSVSCNSQ
jgi:hypothetical protein